MPLSPDNGERNSFNGRLFFENGLVPVWKRDSCRGLECFEAGSWRGRLAELLRVPLEDEKMIVRVGLVLVCLSAVCSLSDAKGANNPPAKFEGYIHAYGKCDSGFDHVNRYQHYVRQCKAWCDGKPNCAAFHWKWIRATGVNAWGHCTFYQRQCKTDEFSSLGDHIHHTYIKIGHPGFKLPGSKVNFLGLCPELPKKALFRHRNQNPRSCMKWCMYNNRGKCKSFILWSNNFCEGYTTKCNAKEADKGKQVQAHFTKKKHWAQTWIVDEPQNLVVFGSTYMTYPESYGPAAAAVDGNYYGIPKFRACAIHRPIYPAPFFIVKLGRYFLVRRIVITNRADSHSNKMKEFLVGVVHKTSWNPAWKITGDKVCGEQKAAFAGQLEIVCAAPILGKSVVVQMKDLGRKRALSVCEIEVYEATGDDPMDYFEHLEKKYCAETMIMMANHRSKDIKECALICMSNPRCGAVLYHKRYWCHFLYHGCEEDKRKANGGYDMLLKNGHPGMEISGYGYAKGKCKKWKQFHQLRTVNQYECAKWCNKYENCEGFYWYWEAWNRGWCRMSKEEICDEDKMTKNNWREHMYTRSAPNMALLGKAYGSSFDGHFTPDRAVDGILGVMKHLRTCFASKKSRDNWWAVDLGFNTRVKKLMLFTTRKGDFGGVRSIVTDDKPRNGEALKFVDNEVCDTIKGTAKRKAKMSCAGAKVGRYVVLHQQSKKKRTLEICEVIVMGMKDYKVKHYAMEEDKACQNHDVIATKKGLTPGDCADVCNQDAKCFSFTYKEINKAMQCFFKGSLCTNKKSLTTIRKNLKATQIWIHYVKMKHPGLILPYYESSMGLYFHGRNFHNVKLYPAQCAFACEKDKRCGGFRMIWSVMPPYCQLVTKIPKNVKPTIKNHVYYTYIKQARNIVIGKTGLGEGKFPQGPIDGIMSGFERHHSCFISKPKKGRSWYAVDMALRGKKYNRVTRKHEKNAILQKAFYVRSVHLMNRADKCCVKQLKQLTIIVTDNKPLVPHDVAEICGSVQKPDTKAGKWKKVRCRFPLTGQFVVIRKDGNEPFGLCEMAVDGWPSTDKNVAVKKKTDISSFKGRSKPDFAVDGKLNTNVGADLCAQTLTNMNGKAAWWSVDLAGTYFISAVTLRSRSDCCAQSLSEFTISVSTSKPRWNFEPIKVETCNYVKHTVPLAATWSVKCRDPSIGQYVIVSQNVKGTQLTICEAEVFGRHMKIENPIGFWPLTAGLKGTDVAKDAKKQKANGNIVDAISRPGPLNKPYTAFTIKRGGKSTFHIPRQKKLTTRYDFTFMLYIFQAQRVDDSTIVTWDSGDRKLLIKNKRLVLGINTAMDNFAVTSKTTIPVDKWVLVGASFNKKTGTGSVFIDDQVTQKVLGKKVKPSSTSMDDIFVGKGHYVGGVACMQLYKVPMTLMEFTGASSRCKHYMKSPGDQAVNIAKKKPAFQSSTWNKAAAARATDGDDAPNMWRHSCSATVPNSKEHWWAVDLQDLRLVTSVKITNRLDCCHKRLRDFRVLVTTDRPIAPLGFDAVDVCVHQKKHMEPGQSKIFSCREGGLTGKYVSVTKKGKDSLTLCEVEVFGDKLLFQLKKGHQFIWRTVRVTEPRRGEKKILKEVANLKLCQRACLSENTFKCLSLEYEYLKKRCRLYDEKMKMKDNTKVAVAAVLNGSVVTHLNSKTKKKPEKKDDKKAKLIYYRNALKKVEGSRDLLQKTKQNTGQLWKLIVDRIKHYQKKIKDMTKGVPKTKKKISGRLEPGIARAPFVYSEPRSVHPKKTTLSCPRGKLPMWNNAANWVLNQAPMKNINGIDKIQDCRKLCKSEKNFICLSFAFNQELKSCALWDQNTATPGLKRVLKMDYTFAQWGCVTGNIGTTCHCHGWGDPHFRAFNGRKMDYQMPCKYTAAKSKDRDSECTFDVESKSERYRHPRSPVSITVMIDVKIFGHLYRFKRLRLFIDGRLYTDMAQANRVHPDVFVHKEGVKVLNCGLIVAARNMYIGVDVAQYLWKNKVEGYCGNCASHNPPPYQFSKYQVPDDSGIGGDPNCMKDAKPQTCTGKWATAVRSKDYCGYILDFAGPFKHCLHSVKRNDFYKNCKFDVCQYTHNPTQAKAEACDALSNLADKCASLKKKVLPFRRPDFCPMECQRNAEYRVSTSACPASCDNMDSEKNCDLPAKEGCACKTGYVLNEKRKCVVKDLCSPKSLADIVFLIDMSDMMGPQLAARAKDLVADIIDTFDISPKTTQISVIPYACNGAINTLLYTAYSSRPELVEATRNLPFVGGCSKLPKALDHVYAKVLNPSLEKLRPGDIYSKIIVLVTPDDVADNDAVVEKTKKLVRKMGKVIWFKYNSKKKPPARDLTILPFIFPIPNPEKVDKIVDEFSLTIFKEVKCGEGFYNHVTKYTERCSDIDECGLDVCSKGSTCVNTKGRYRCICKPGYCFHSQLGCIDNNECSVNPCLPGSQCTNTVGSYKCICKTGFQYHPKRSCYDINECKKGGRKLCKKGSVCKNTLGSYVCQCKPGFVYKPDIGCAVTDVCKAKKPCKGIAKCQNVKKKSYKCNCPKGFKSDGKNGCREINLCKPNPCKGKTAICRMNKETYMCICPEDFEYTKVGCKRKDPCDKKPCKGGAHCSSENGEFYCACLGDMFYNEEVGCEEAEIMMPESKIVMIIDGSGDETKNKKHFPRIRQSALDIGVKLADKSEMLNMGLIVLGGKPRYEVPQLTRPVDDYDTLFEDVLHEGGKFSTTGLLQLITKNKELKMANTEKVIVYVLTHNNKKWSPLLESVCKQTIKSKEACHYEIILHGHQTQLVDPSPYFVAVPTVMEMMDIWVSMKEIAVSWMHCPGGFVHNGHECQKMETVVSSCKFKEEEFAIGSTWTTDCVTYKCMRDGYVISGGKCVDYSGRCVLADGVTKYKCKHKGRIHYKCTCTIKFNKKGIERKIQIVQTVQPSISIMTDKMKGKGKKCVFPFIYDNRPHYECTNFMSDTPWCATVEDLDLDMQSWGYCVDEKKAKCAHMGVIKFEGDKWSDENCWSFECHKKGKLTSMRDSCPTKGPEGCVPRGTRDYECEIEGVVYQSCECTGEVGNARYYAMQPMETVQMAYGDADLIYFCVFREVEVPMGKTIDADCYKFKCVELKSPDPKVTKAVGATMERIGEIRCPYKLGKKTICIPLGKKQGCGKLPSGKTKQCSCVDNDDGMGPHIEEETEMVQMQVAEWKKK